MVSFGGGGGSKQKSSSKPVDLTPAEYTALRPIISNAILQLLMTGGPAFGQATTAFPGGMAAPQPLAAPAAAKPKTAAGRGGTPQPQFQTVPRFNEDRGTRTIPGGSPNRQGIPATMQGAGPTLGSGAGASGPTGGPFNLTSLLGQSAGQANTQNIPGDFAAPLQQNEQTLLDALMGQIANPVFAAGQDQLASTIRGDFLRPESNPFLSAMIDTEQRRLGEAFRDVEAPALQSRFTRAGQQIQPQGSSAFDTAAAIALRGLTSAQGDVATQLAGQNFQAERGRQLDAVQIGSQVSSQEVERLTSILQSQALPRLIEQYGIDKGLEEFRRRMDMILAALGIGAQISSPTVANVGQSSGKTSPSFEFGIGT